MFINHDRVLLLDIHSSLALGALDGDGYRLPKVVQDLLGLSAHSNY